MIEAKNFFPPEDNYPPVYVAQDIKSLKEGRAAQITSSTKEFTGGRASYWIEKTIGVDRVPALDGVSRPIKFLPIPSWKRTCIVYLDHLVHEPQKDPTDRVHLGGKFISKTSDITLYDQTGEILAMPHGIFVENHYPYVSVFEEERLLVSPFAQTIHRVYREELWQYYRGITWGLPVYLLAQFRPDAEGNITDRYWLLDIIDTDRTGKRRPINLPKKEPVSSLQPRIIEI